MKNNECSFFIGGIEQAVAGGCDPLNPPISISRNGSLAKWRGKFQALDIRVNDPGLKRYRSQFEEMMEKTTSLGMEPLVTLPEAVPIFFDLPPELFLDTDSKADFKANKPGHFGRGACDKLVAFKTALLAVPKAVIQDDLYQCLSVEDCLPVIESASGHGVNKLIVAVSEPGLFIDAVAFEEFRSKIRQINDYARSKSLQIHIKTGGISRDFFRQLHRETGCKLAIHVGTAHLERENLLDLYEEFRDDVEILYFHQALPGIDKWSSRKKSIISALNVFVQKMGEYRNMQSGEDPVYREKSLARVSGAVKDFNHACKTESSFLGLFQTGDINMVPLLKAIKKDLEDGKPRYCFLETVPNTKNSDFIMRYLMPEGFPGAF